MQNQRRIEQRAVEIGNTERLPAHLRDPLIGWRCCVKLFRTACFGHTAFRDTVSPDTDFVQDIEKQGFVTVYAVRFDDTKREFRHTFGEHSPEYSFDYSFRKHLIEGRRYMYRNNFPSFRWLMGQLERRRDDASLTAQVATAHGLFLDDRQDLLASGEDSDDQAIVEAFRRRMAGTEGDTIKLALSCLTFVVSPASAFRRHYYLGVKIARHGSAQDIRNWVLRKNSAASDARAITKIAFCHGLFQSRHRSRDGKRKQAFLRGFVGQYWPAISCRALVLQRIDEARAAFRLVRERGKAADPR